MACEISRRSQETMIGSLANLVSKAMSLLAIWRSSTAARTTSRMSWSSICGLGMRAKAENSSTMRVTSPTWRMMVSVQRSKTSRSSVITLPYLRLMRSAESCMGVSGFLISWAMRRATSAHAEVRCAEHQLGDVVEGERPSRSRSSPSASWVTRTAKLRSSPPMVSVTCRCGRPRAWGRCSRPAGSANSGTASARSCPTSSSSARRAASAPSGWPA